MAQYQTTTSKGLNGWKSETVINLEKISDTATRILEITTYKGYTNASVSILKNEPSSNFTSKEHVLFEDYNERVCKNDVKRATNKSIEAAHKSALTSIPPFINAVLAQYNLETTLN